MQMDATLLSNNSQHCWMLHVASVCTPCCMLLDVVACCCAKFETSQTFQPTTPNISFVPWSPKRSATMLDPFAQLFQHCWGHARSLRMDYKDLWVVFFPRCTAGPNIVGSCCIRLHTTANTHATTPNIVGATMLGVVVSVCTQPYVCRLTNHKTATSVSKSNLGSSEYYSWFILLALSIDIFDLYEVQKDWNLLGMSLFWRYFVLWFNNDTFKQLSFFLVPDILDPWLLITYTVLLWRKLTIRR